MNKASGGDGIPVELFKILKDDAVKVLHWICQQIWKSQQWPQDWKRSVFIPVPKKGNTKECSDYYTTRLISHARQVMLKILQARLQDYMNQEREDLQAGFRKGRGTRDRIAAIHWITEKLENSRKTSTSASLTVLKPLIVCITINQGKFLKRWEHQTTLLAFWWTYVQVKKNQTWNNRRGSKLGKEYVTAVYCHLAYLTYMQSTLCEMPDWMKHKLESRLPGEI